MQTTNETKQTFTRSEYLDGKCSHREYYGQFINPTILSRVAGWFRGYDFKEALKEDEHLNNIPLAKWDGFVQSKQLFDVSR